MVSRTHTPARGPERWRANLRRHVTLALAVKLAALALLWALFFSAAHRTLVDGQAAGRHLAVTPEEGARD